MTALTGAGEPSLVWAMKRFMKSVFRLFGLEVHRAGRPGHSGPRLQRGFLEGVLGQARKVGFSPSTIIDVGAAHGTFTQACLGLFPEARYILIEPLAEYAPFLDRIVGSLKQGDCVRAAAAAEPGETTLNVHPDLVGSSLYREVEEGSNVNGVPRAVRVVTVDGVIKETGAKGPFLLKADVQGAELDVLRGAEDTLREAEYVVLEVSFFKFFENGPECCDVVTFMKSKGFVPYDLCGLQYRPLDDSLSQADIAFVKEGGAFRRQHGYATPEQREEQNRQIQDYLRRLAGGTP